VQQGTGASHCVSPRPFAGYTNSDFAYIGLGVSQDVPYPGKLKLRGEIAKREADVSQQQIESMRRAVLSEVKAVYFQLAYLSKTLAILDSDGELLKQVAQVADARYRSGMGTPARRAPGATAEDEARTRDRHASPGGWQVRSTPQRAAKLQFPGLSNTWTMPVENRLDMELTGIKTPLGMKIQGPTLEGIQQAGAQIQQALSTLPEVRSAFAERVSQGFYVNIEVNREEASRYGLTVADVQQAVSSGIGGAMVTENIEGRERYPVNVRYNRDFRNNVDELRRVLIATPSGAQIPIEQVARISFSRGPSMIRDEDGALTGYVYIDLKSKDYGDFVRAADNTFKQKLHLPAGFTYKWVGEYEFELRARQRLQVILPVVFFVIFVLLYMVFHSVAESAVLIFPTLYALTGGLILQKLLGYNFSVAVWVGYIALFGIAVETGVVMVVYLHEALNRRLASGKPVTHEDIEEAIIEGAVHDCDQN